MMRPIRRACSIAGRCRSPSGCSMPRPSSQRFQNPWWAMIVARPDAGRPPLTVYTLALNYLPLAQLLTGAALVTTAATSQAALILGLLAWIYLVPPLACRLALIVFGRPQGRALTQHDRAYKVWWFTYQWQVLFNRLPWLDEILRLVPGLYALWIFLWGGRASPLVYWAPGALVIDRPLLVVERGAVIGAGSGLPGHSGPLGPDGSFRIDIGTAHIGRGAIMGARSGLSAGELASGRMLPAGRMIKPFTRWDGKTKQALDPGGDDA